MKVVNNISLKYLYIILVSIILGICLIFGIMSHLETTHQNRTADQRYGIAVGTDLLHLSAPELETRLTELDKLGAGWVRLDFEWGTIQPTSRESYHWEAYDRVVQAFTAHRYNVIGILDFTPAWARLPECSAAKQCAPANPADYGTFAGHVAERYKGSGLHYWEIWNEPNTITFFQPKPNPATYTEMLIQAYTSIHHANPQAVVISGGTAPSASDGTNLSQADFLNALYDHQGGSHFDAVGAHPYTYPVGPDYQSDHAWAALAHSQTNLRGIMTAHGDAARTTRRP